MCKFVPQGNFSDMDEIVRREIFFIKEKDCQIFKVNVS
jgi:hypothetical protein